MYDLKVIEPYINNPAYESGRLAIINKALKGISGVRQAVCSDPVRQHSRVSLEPGDLETL